MGVESSYGLKFGYMDHGPRNLITDVRVCVWAM